MENVIKGLHLLNDTGIVNPLEKVALVCKDKYNVTFNIIKVTAEDVTIRATQGDTIDGKYYDAAGLIALTKFTFTGFMQGKKIHVHAVPHVISPVDLVTAEWIKDKMLKTGTKLKDIVAETGLNKSYLSTLTNGVDPLSTMAKAMFFYYFLAKEYGGITIGRKKEKKDKS